MKKKPSSYQLRNKELHDAKNEIAKLKNAASSMSSIINPPAPLTDQIPGQKIDDNPLKKRLKRSTHISEKIPYVQTLYRIKTDIASWRAALFMAENVQSPQRTELYRLYKEIMLDGHLSSTIQNRKASILSCNFFVEGKPELNPIFKTKWFFDFINLSLDSMYFGHSLIDFGDLDLKTMEFTDIKCVPREYVKPEFHIITKNYSDLQGVDYTTDPNYLDWAIGVGEDTNLGLLAKCAPYVLWARGAYIAYAEYAEMCGIPIRILRTGAYDEETRNTAENFMRNMASSAYGIIGLDDEVIFAESKNVSGVEQMFNGLINKCQDAISKIILGGAGISDTAAFVGSAKIHMDIFLLICELDKKFIQNVLNYQLKPLLERQGILPEGCYIQVKPEEELDLPAQFAVDSKLLDYYKIPAEYFNKKYGTELTDLPITPEEGNGQNITDNGSADGRAKLSIPKDDFTTEHPTLQQTTEKNNPQAQVDKEQSKRK